MQNIPGFYGKIPDLGDFVNRRLPGEFVGPWDEWLQDSVAASKDALQSAWLDHYLKSPIWRFVIAEGLCGAAPWMGLMMPSVDRVGRYYPLVLACKLPSLANPIEIINVGKTWFELADDVILSVLDSDLDLESFDEQVVSLGGLDKLMEGVNPPTEIGFGNAWQLSIEEGDMVKPMSMLTHQLLLQRLGQYSVWWGAGTETIDSGLLICAGLPLTSDYASMLTGDWNSGSWEQWSSRLSPETVGLMEFPQY